MRAGNLLRPFAVSLMLTLGLSSLTAVTAHPASAAPKATAAPAGTHPKKGLPGPVRPLPAPPGARAVQRSGAASRAMAGPAAPAPKVTVPAVMRADAQALARALATGKPVALPSLTSQTSEVLAQPNGQFELVSNTMPVRVQAGGAWQPVSTVLRPGANGAWSAPLTSAPVTFSGGGRGPLVAMTDSLTGKSASVTFPYPLPRPVVTGSTALYKDVFPGTDLRVQATSTGYSEVLIVRTAAAARDRRLRSLTFTLIGGPGTAVRSGPLGSTAVVNAASGKQVFASGQPVMWDSGPSPARAAAARAGGAGSGATGPVPVPVRRVLGVGGSPARATLTLTPAVTALAGRQVRYPLYIDPQVNQTSPLYYSEVSTVAGPWNTTTGTTSQPSGVVQAGFCGYDSNAPIPCSWNHVDQLFTNRVYFRVNTSVLAPRGGFRPNVYSASFAPHEVYNSAGCTSEPVAVWSTSGDISSSTDWPGPQGSQLGTASSNAGGGTGCSGAADVPVDITSVIQQHIQNADAPPSMAFEVRAPDETNKLQWKKFSDNPTFTVWYNYAPLQPTDLAVSNAVTCTATTYTSDNQPTISARGVDNNPQPEDLNHTFRLVDSTGTLVSATGNGVFANGGRHSGDPASTNVRGQWTDSTVLSDGSAYHFTDVTQNLLPNQNDPSDKRNSPVSPAYFFTVLHTPPASPPAITTADYPVDAHSQAYWGQPQGAPAVFTVGTNGASNIAGFAYDFDLGANFEPVPSTTDCHYQDDGGLGTSQDGNGYGSALGQGELALVRGSTAQIQVPPGLPAGRHTLWVKSFDYAHNSSGDNSYVFYVTPNYQNQATVQLLPDSPDGPATLWASQGGPNVSLLTEQATCCGMAWPGNDQIRFGATAVGQSYSLSVNVPATGTWQLGADMTLAPDYGQVKFDLDGANLAGTAATPFEGYAASVSSVYLDLGTRALTAGAHTLSITVTGQNASSIGFRSGLIYLALNPTNRYEAVNLTYGNATAGTLAPQCAGQPAWADNCQLFLSSTVPNASFQVTFTAPVESDYALGVNLTMGSDYGTLKFELDTGTDSYLLLDNTLQDPINAYGSSTTAQYVFLGGVHLTSGTHALKVTVVDTDGRSTGNRYNAGINYVAAAPVTGAKMDSFTDAMNNLGIVSDDSLIQGNLGTTFGTGFMMNFDLVNSSTGNNLSLQALAAAGITAGTRSGPGNTFSLGGATFTMPQLRTDTATGPVVADNVIPDGQTITLNPPGTGKESGVALLVTSSCGPSPAASATLNYSGAQSANPGIPSIPEWSAGATNVAVMQLGHHDNGTTPDTDSPTAPRPRLYEVILPANPNAPLASITLPVLPVNYLTDSGSCATSAGLPHILAIGFRSPGQPAAGGAWTGTYDAPMDTALPQSPAVTDRTYRLSVPLTSPGSGTAPTIRLHLSNAYSDTPLAFDAVTVAAQSTTSSFAPAAAPVTVTFGGHSCVSTSAPCVTMPAGGDAYSGEVTLPSMAGSTGKLMVSLHVPASVPAQAVPVHEQVQGISTAWAAGDVTANSDGAPFSSANSAQGEFFLSGVDVSDATASDGTVAVLGDQTAVAAPAFSTATWPADLPSALTTGGISVPGAVVNASTSDAPPEDWWRMTGQGLETGTTAFDSGTIATKALTLNGGAHFAPADSQTGIADNPGTGVTPGSLVLSGSNQSAQTAGPVITSTSSFAVSAWVKLSSLPTRNAAVAAQDGTNASGFYLGYNYAHSGTGVWAFYFAGSDVSNPAVTGAYGPASASALAPAVNAWTLLTGVYNGSTGAIQVYVNGTLAASATYTPAWSASGAFTVGRSKFNGSATDYFPGEISDVRAYSRLVWGTDVSRIAGDTGMSSVTSGNAGIPFWNSALEDGAAVEPNLRDVIISLGANDVLQGTDEATIESNLRALVSNIQGRYQSAPGGVPVQVFITTIPPLGLAASDARETVRQDVNQWLTSFGTLATDVFDIAGAVASSSTPNVIAPAYLSGGVPTSAYYSAVATEVPTAMTNAFPVPDTF
jgi:hypothetical protein